MREHCPPLISNPAANALKVPFGRLGERIVAPSAELPKGLACGCACPGCGARLVLRQGRKRPHFAHYNAPATTRCVEQAIHSAAIQAVLDARYLPLPALQVEVSRRADDGEQVTRFHTLRPEAIARFDACRAEVTFDCADLGAIRADVVGQRGERQLIVEMWFKHAVDLPKHEKLKQLGLPAVEVYLGDLDLEHGLEVVAERVLGSARYTQWLFHPELAGIKASLQAAVNEEVEERNACYAKAQEAQLARRAAAAMRLAEQMRIQQEQKRQKQAALAEKDRRLQAERAARRAQYRARTVGSKLAEVHRKLAPHGTWPPQLSLESPHNLAVDAPPELWQRAFVHYFILSARARPALQLRDALAWMHDWYGEVPGRGGTLEEAVRDYLAHLHGLGFLLSPGRATYGVTYTVRHRDLTLPVKPPAPGRRQDEVEWNPTWPDYDAVRNSITKWISGSQRDELTILDTLFRERAHLPSPLEFGLRIGLPTGTVFNFLRNHGFVL